MTGQSGPADDAWRGEKESEIAGGRRPRGRVVIDTTVLIDLLRGSAAALAWLEGLPTAPYCSEISRVEVVRGLRSAERARAHRIFAGLRWVPVTTDIASLAGEFGRDHRRSHTGLGVADLVIAATAIYVGADLATHNVRHFPMFPGLTAPY